MDEDDSAVLGKDDVRGTREVLDVYTVTISETPKGMAQV